MTQLLPPEVIHLRDAVIRGPAETPTRLRTAVEAFVACLCGGRRSNSPVPDELQPYLDKLARYAYKITDEDVARLQAAGFSEGAIFELSVAGALGAGLARLERGLALLQEMES